LGGEALVDPEGFENIWSTLKDKYVKDGRPVTSLLFFYFYS